MLVSMLGCLKVKILITLHRCERLQVLLSSDLQEQKRGPVGISRCCCAQSCVLVAEAIAKGQ